MPATVGAPITERELEVLAAFCVAQGTRAAADRLGLSTWTVKSHLESIRIKLGVSSTATAVYLLRERLPSAD